MEQQLQEEQAYGVWNILIPYIVDMPYIIGADKKSFSGQARIAELCMVCKLFNNIITSYNWFGGREIWQEYIEKYNERKEITIIIWKTTFRNSFKSFMGIDDLNSRLETLDLRPNKNGELLIIRKNIERKLMNITSH